MNLNLNKRLERRLAFARWYYTRQQMLYLVFEEAPDVANTIGIFPKIDNSHGFSHHSPYEMYRDWQENTINSDGWFAMLVYFICGAYTIHVFFTYITPFYWINYDTRNEPFLKWRMKGSY